MKKLILIFVFLVFSLTAAMYDQGPKLKYDEIKLINKSQLPLELRWVEIKRPEGTQEDLKKEIAPGETTVVKLGQVGGYYPNKPAQIVYSPIAGNNSFKQEFEIDLPNSKAFAFTASKLADVMNSIWVPGILTADDKGDFSSFKYNLGHSQFNNLLEHAFKAKSIS